MHYRSTHRRSGLRFIGPFLVLLIGILLVGCTTTCKRTRSDTRDSQVIRLFDSHDQLLKKNDIQLIRVGDELTWVLPVNRFFYPDSANLTPGSYPVLNALANIFRSYEKVSVKVAGYTDNSGSPVRNLALSEKRAHMISIYLWRQGVDSRMIYATGYGEKNPIASNGTMRGRLLNRRVEITFHEIMS